MAPKENPETILLHGRDPDHDEGKASESFTPGMVITQTGTDTDGAKDVPQFGANDTDGAKVSPRIALEAQLGGIGKGIDDDYESGEPVAYKVLEPGDKFYGLVFDGDNAAGSGTDVSGNANISAGDRLVVYGGAGEAGTFRAFDGDAEGAALVEARESVDASGASSPQRIVLEAI